MRTSTPVLSVAMSILASGMSLVNGCQTSDTDTVISAASIPVTTSEFKFTSDFIEQHQFRVSVRNLNKHEIGRYQAKQGPWTPITGRRETLRGTVTHYEVATVHPDQDEYDWCIKIDPAPAFERHLGKDVIECEVTPSDFFHDNDWFPAKGTGIPHPLLSKQLCAYGPFVIDEGNDHGKEIHPVDAFWWQEVSGRNENILLMLVQDAAKERFREFDHFIFDDNIDPDWVRWVLYPQREEILIPFTYRPSDRRYMQLNIQVLRSLHVATGSDPTMRDSDTGHRHRLRLSNEVIAAARPMPIAVEVNEQQGKKYVLGVQFTEISKDAQGAIHGYIRLLAALGNAESKEEGVIVLRLNFDSGRNEDPELIGS